MKPLDHSSFRSAKVIQPHLKAGRNVLPSSWEQFFCLIPNNRPFLYNMEGTPKSLHTILTSPGFDFKDIFELNSHEMALYGKIEAFCTTLYNAHIILNNEYTGARVIKLEEMSTYPQFHKHFSLAKNEAGDKTSASVSTNTEFRNAINSGGSKKGEINDKDMNNIVSSLKETRDLLLNPDNDDIINSSGINLSKKAQQLATEINQQIAVLFEE